MKTKNKNIKPQKCRITFSLRRMTFKEKIKIIMDVLKNKITLPELKIQSLKNKK